MTRRNVKPDTVRPFLAAVWRLNQTANCAPKSREVVPGMWPETISFRTIPRGLRTKHGAFKALSLPQKVREMILARADVCRNEAGNYAAGRDNSIRKGITSAFGTLRAPTTN